MPSLRFRPSFPRSRLYPVGVAALAGIVLFQGWGNLSRGYIDSASLFYWWGFQWFNPGSEAEHGPLILLLAAGLLWRNLRGVAAADAGGRWLAGGLLLGGLAGHTLGLLGQEPRVSIVGLLVYVGGLIILAGGRAAGRAAVFPLGLLLLAVPLSALDEVGFWLRLGVVDASAGLARGLGIEVLSSGTELLSPDGRYHYDVAAACSGVRSLQALLALALLAGYFSFRSLWRRLLIFLLVIPATFWGNVVRLLAIVVAGETWGQAAGERVHASFGFLIFVVVLGVLLAAVSLLRRWMPEPAEALETVEHPAPRSGSRRAAGWDCAAAALMGVVLVAWLAQTWRERPLAVAAGVRLSTDGLQPVELPLFLGRDWIGRPVEVSSVERELLPPDTGYSRQLYYPTRPTERPVFFSMVLSGRDRTSLHRPELCLVGQGWTIEARERREWDLGVAGQRQPATVLRVRRQVTHPDGSLESIPALVTYWYVSEGTAAADALERWRKDVFHRLRRGQAPRWAYVLLQTEVDTEEQARRRVQAVLASAWPAVAPGPATLP